MPTSRIVLALALLPTLALAPACDDKDVPHPGDVADTDDDTTDGDTTDTPDSTDGESTTGQIDPAATEGNNSASDTEGDVTDSAGNTEGGSDDPPPPPPPVKPDPAEPCPDTPWSGMECTTEGGEAGTSFCIVDGGEQVWTECATEVACYPGDSWDQGCMGNICAYEDGKLYSYSWSEPDCNTPLILDFEGAPLRFDAVTPASFDISGVGECLATDWPTLPWLALDRDHDGTIESGRELFGSGTRLRDGSRARDGFEALRELDSNFDGRIDAADPAFAELVLWSDHDGDRRGDLAELLPAAAMSLVAIHLDVAVRVECDDRGNCGRERSRFEFRTPTGELRTGEVIDVYLACQ